MSKTADFIIQLEDIRNALTGILPYAEGEAEKLYALKSWEDEEGDAEIATAARERAQQALKDFDVLLGRNGEMAQVPEPAFNRKDKPVSAPYCMYEDCDQEPAYCAGHFQAEADIASKTKAELFKTRAGLLSSQLMLCYVRNYFSRLKFSPDNNTNLEALIKRVKEQIIDNSEVL